MSEAKALDQGSNPETAKKTTPDSERAPQSQNLTQKTHNKALRAIGNRKIAPATTLGALVVAGGLWVVTPPAKKCTLPLMSGACNPSEITIAQTHHISRILSSLEGTLPDIESIKNISQRLSNEFQQAITKNDTDAIFRLYKQTQDFEEGVHYLDTTFKNEHLPFSVIDEIAQVLEKANASKNMDMTSTFAEIRQIVEKYKADSKEGILGLQTGAYRELVEANVLFEEKPGTNSQEIQIGQDNVAKKEVLALFVAAYKDIVTMRGVRTISELDINKEDLPWIQDYITKRAKGPINLTLTVTTSYGKFRISINTISKK